jgi:hypothetical protein
MNFMQRRTIREELVCTYHSDSNKEWFTKSNRDGIPTCTECNISLIPASFKEVLVSGNVSSAVPIDRASAVAAGSIGALMLWSFLNSITKRHHLTSTGPANAENAERLEDWPNVPEPDFIWSFGESLDLGSVEFGYLVECIEFFGLSSSCFTWTAEDAGDDKVLKLYPKPQLNAIISANYESVLSYLRKAEALFPNAEIWNFVNKLKNQIGNQLPEPVIQGYFGFEVELEHHLEGTVVPSEKIVDKFGVQGEEDLVRISLIYPNALERARDSDIYFRDISYKIVGPFDHRLRTLRIERPSGDAERVTWSQIHYLKFFVKAVSEAAAREFLESNFQQEFGLISQTRADTPALIEGGRAVRWDTGVQDSAQTRITSIRALNKEEMAGTPWATKCIWP